MSDYTPTINGLVPQIGLTLVMWIGVANPVPLAGPWEQEPNPFLNLRGNCAGTIGSSIGLDGIDHEATVLVCDDHPYRLPVGAHFALRDADGKDLFIGTDGGILDINKDGFIDGVDFDLFMNSWEIANPFSDFNNDGFVDGIDYDLFLNTWEPVGIPKDQPIGRPRPK